jgi:hypothetical protein
MLFLMILQKNKKKMLKNIIYENMKSEKDRLQRQLNETKAKLEQLEKEEKKSNREIAIKSLEEYTDKEKIDFFDKLYREAQSELENYEENGYSDEDNAQYAWESYIEILARNNTEFWNYWNSLEN